jgi:death on curing protein
MVLTIEDVKQIRNVIENNQISYKGIKDIGLLELILENLYYHPYGYDPFPTIYSKCAYLFESICTEHPFYDGNKRTSLIIANVFMRKNGYYLVIPLSAVRYSILVAQKKRNLGQITKWVKKHSAKTTESYIQKRSKFLINPVTKIIWLLENDNEKKGYRLLNYWLAFDIYPEYKLEIREMLDFLFNIANS